MVIWPHFRFATVFAIALLGAAAWTSAQRAPAHPKTPAKPVETPAAASPVPADLTVKRLILKDGSYQGVVKFEIQGDRVHYLSAERYEWEDLPYSIVDWPATEKFAREALKPKASTEAAEIDKEEQAERQKEEQASPLVAPGLRLPVTGGILLLDVYRNQAQLNQMEQSGSELKQHKASDILRGTINPLAGQKQTIELPGAHARIQSHVPNPFLYINVEEEDTGSAQPHADAMKDNFRIVRVESDPKKNTRIVGSLNRAIYGKVSQSQKYVPVKAEVFTPAWLKITPAVPLEPGEYALVELLKDNQMNMYVWDFGVNPNAPENAGAWKQQ
jgi:hypothetical protein